MFAYSGPLEETEYFTSINIYLSLPRVCLEPDNADGFGRLFQHHASRRRGVETQPVPFTSGYQISFHKLTPLALIHAALLSLEVFLQGLWQILLMMC